MSDDNGYVVTLVVYGLKTREDAKKYAEALTDAFCDMPESEPYASTTRFCSAVEFEAMKERNWGAATRCAECDCESGGADCTWIASGEEVEKVKSDDAQRED